MGHVVHVRPFMSWYIQEMVFKDKPIEACSTLAHDIAYLEMPRLIHCPDLCCNTMCMGDAQLSHESFSKAKHLSTLLAPPEPQASVLKQATSPIAGAFP